MKSNNFLHISMWLSLQFAATFAHGASVQAQQRFAKSMVSIIANSDDNDTTKELRNASKDETDFSTWELLISEDFSNFTEGSENNIDYHPIDNFAATGSDPTIPDEYMQTPGWSGAFVFQAGGICALTYPGQGGVFNTPLGNYQGQIGVTFRAKTTGLNTGFTVNINRGGVATPQLVNARIVYMSSEYGWTDIEFIGINPYSDEDAFIQINAMGFNTQGILVDDLKVYRNPDYITTPQELSADSFVNDGFTAHWSPVSNAKTYLLNVWEETTLEEDNRYRQSQLSGKLDY